MLAGIDIEIESKFDAFYEIPKKNKDGSSSF